MAKQVGIEQHFERLEQAVAALERDDLPLEDALATYASGLQAVRAARAQLDSYGARLEELRAEADGLQADAGETDA